MQVADSTARNKMLKEELKALKERLRITNPGRVEIMRSNNVAYSNQIENLKAELNSRTLERDALRKEVNQPPQVEIIDVYDDAGVAQLEEDIMLVKEKNMNLQ